MSTSTSSILQCAYLPAVPVSLPSAAMPLLGEVIFGTPASVPAEQSDQSNHDWPSILVPMPALDPHGSPAAMRELWQTDGKHVAGRSGDVQYVSADALMFGAVQLDEARFADQAATDKTPLQCAAEHAYRSIFLALKETGYPHILRLWNYIADINGESHGIERYRQFNIGRHDGFLAAGREVEGGAVPAASAVGFPAGPLTVYFLAARNAQLSTIENPRQVSAYQYPREYGPRSPTFSRAALAKFDDQHILFLSGTASIVGHRTLHVGDVRLQTRETIANITAVLNEANRVAPTAQLTLAELCYKVYIRNEADLAIVRDELHASLGADARLLFLQADICRDNLLVEIEATAGHPLSFATAA